MADKYCGYRELRAAEASDAFEVSVVDRNTQTVVLAPHGGRIELGTSQITRAVAGNELSFYTFDGKKASNNADLHITSTRFDEPMALALVARSESCVAVHGAEGQEKLVFLGGLHEALKTLLHQRLTKAGFEVAEPADPDLQGTNPLNICNQGASRAGAQLEITRGLRDALTDQADPEATDRLATFANAVRGAIQANSRARLGPPRPAVAKPFPRPSWGQIEHLALLGAIAGAILAAFPLYQWWSEREDRRFARVAGLVEAVSICAVATDSEETMPMFTQACAKAKPLVLAELEQEIAAISDLPMSYLRSAIAPASPAPSVGTGTNMAARDGGLRGCTRSASIAGC